MENDSDVTKTIMFGSKAREQVHQNHKGQQIRKSEELKLFVCATWRALSKSCDKIGDLVKRKRLLMSKRGDCLLIKGKFCFHENLQPHQ